MSARSERLVLLAAAVLSLALAGCDPDVEAARVLRRADQQVSAGKPDQARKLYRQYLQQASQLGATRDIATEMDVHRKLAGLEADAHHWHTARSLLKQALAEAFVIQSRAEAADCRDRLKRLDEQIKGSER